MFTKVGDNTAVPKKLGGFTFWFPQTSRYILTVLKRRSKLIDTQSKIQRSMSSKKKKEIQRSIKKMKMNKPKFY